jgi:hypothetical protein
LGEFLAEGGDIGPKLGEGLRSLGRGRYGRRLGGRRGGGLRLLRAAQFLPHLGLDLLGGLQVRPEERADDLLVEDAADGGRDDDADEGGDDAAAEFLDVLAEVISTSCFMGDPRPYGAATERPAARSPRRKFS